MEDWGLYLPMASAILTVLFPNEFTVYDVRICETLTRYKKLGARHFSDDLCKEYAHFKDAVATHAPAHPSLRDKDRYLWGKSRYEQVLSEISKLNSQ